MNEVWKDIPGWERHYQASTLGRIRRIRPSILVMKPRLVHQKYLVVKLTMFGQHKTLYVHRLVCETFTGPPPPGHNHCCHQDGNSRNNAAANLRWDTPQANEADKLLHGTHNRGERHALSKLSEDQVRAIKRELAAGVQQKAIAERFGVSQGCIYTIKTGKRWGWIQ